MVPHMSGTTLDAQARYAAGVRNILERYFTGKEQTPSDVIVINGEYATRYVRSDPESNVLGRMGNATNKLLEQDHIFNF